MELRLREVNPKDMELLYQWANDPTVRQNAFHSEPIPFETHRAWFVRMLSDRDVMLYILYEQQKDGSMKNLGQLRFTIVEGSALIDYSIDATQRGRGLGTKLVLMAEEELKNKRTDVIYCKAQVKYENPASAKVFEKCGYDLKEEQKSQEEQGFLEYWKRIG